MKRHTPATSSNAVTKFAMLATAAAINLGSAQTAHASDEPEIHSDPKGDAVIRRTDLGADGPIHPQAALPDLLAVVIGGWRTSSPANNPYSGRWVDPDDTDLLRIDLVFDDLVNPAGPIGLHGPEYDPFRYGTNPVYAFIEFDVDRETDTGGEVDGVEHRILGNVARFGGTLSHGLEHNAALSGYDLDNNLLTEPMVERSGQEMAISICACQPVLNINTLNDPTPATFDADDTWIVTGRFFNRSHAFSRYSFAFGGSQPGEYNPVVNLRYDHDQSTNRTTISLVYGLTNIGAAALAGQSPQPLNANVADQTSILEALDDTRFTALNTPDPGIGTPFDLLREWRDSNHSDLTEFLNPTRWRINALVGTTYTEPQLDGSLFVWTDVGTDFHFGDFNGNSITNQADQNYLMKAVNFVDGTARDADGIRNGQIRLFDFGLNFALFDLDYDGAINAVDLEPIGYSKLGDINLDRQVTNADMQMLIRMGNTTPADPQYNPASDLNSDNIIDIDDYRIMRQLLR